MALVASDLPTKDGRIYHLDLMPEELAPNIIALGDPGRVLSLADQFLESIEVSREHRGLRVVTGTTKGDGNRITLVTTGMGTPSTEIVLSEIYALIHYDLVTRERKKPLYDKVRIIRLGTSGALQRDTVLGTPIISDYCIGLDNAGLFYDVPESDSDNRVVESKIDTTINKAMAKSARFRERIHCYSARSSSEIVTALEGAAKKLGIKCLRGITVSNAGFFAAQGRMISEIPLSVVDIDDALSKVEPINGLRIENMEMEASVLAHLGRGFGFSVGTICIAIANRRLDTFDVHFEENMMRAAKIAFAALGDLRKADLKG